MKPLGACNRVFNVSIGKRARSTDVPANPPARREVRKGVWRSSEEDDDVAASSVVSISIASMVKFAEWRWGMI